MECPEDPIPPILSDACRPSPWSDALITRRALFECSELAGPNPGNANNRLDTIVGLKGVYHSTFQQSSNIKPGWILDKQCRE